MCKTKYTLTDFFGNYVGVKQGDNLSPNLFKIFINDLPDYLMNTTDPIFINKRSVHCLLYADDVILLSSTSQGLQNKLNKLNVYCNDWCLNINVTKTKVLVFTTRQADTLNRSSYLLLEVNKRATNFATLSELV